MNQNNIEVHSVYHPELAVYKIHILTEGFRPVPDGEEHDPGARFVAKPIEFEAAGRRGLSGGGPALILDKDTARQFMQAMMDAAWNMGLRPSDVKDLEGTLEATRFHLEDMRLLAKVRKDE